MTLSPFLCAGWPFVYLIVRNVCLKPCPFQDFPGGPGNVDLIPKPMHVPQLETMCSGCCALAKEKPVQQTAHMLPTRT